MDEHAEPRLAPPTHTCIALGCRLRVLNRGYRMICAGFAAGLVSVAGFGCVQLIKPAATRTTLTPTEAIVRWTNFNAFPQGEITDGGIVCEKIFS